MASYDIVGNIAIVKFRKGEGAGAKKKSASRILKEHNNVRTVLEKSERFKGRLRLQKTRFIAGEKTKEALYKENNCVFRLNADNCYFSPRLSAERKEIGEMVKRGEKVLVMFGGVAPIAVVIGRIGKVGKIVSVELGRECCKYALENVKRNKLVGRVEICQGDVRKVIGKGKKIDDKFDRVIMARPNLKDSFLDIGFDAVKKGGVIHYYGFYGESEKEELRELILSEAKKAGRKIRILRIKKAGEIGVKKYRYRADFIVY